MTPIQKPAEEHLVIQTAENEATTKQQTPTKPVVKEAAKKDPPKPRQQYFDVRIECLVPTTYTYRVLADNEQAAIIDTKNKGPVSIKQKYQARRPLSATVSNTGSTIIKFVKRFV